MPVQPCTPTPEISGTRRRLAPTVPRRATCVGNAQPITTRSSSPGQFDTDADEDTVPDVITL
jgi:hypothetical protein